MIWLDIHFLLVIFVETKEFNLNFRKFNYIDIFIITLKSIFLWYSLSF